VIKVGAIEEHDTMTGVGSDAQEAAGLLPAGIRTGEERMLSPSPAKTTVGSGSTFPRMGALIVK
jgi:hypothetical protein